LGYSKKSNLTVTMDSYQWAQIITLGLAIAVLVILIVVLTRNSLKAGQTAAEQTIHLDNKVNWLYGLAIAEAGIVVVFGVLTLLAMIRWSRMGK
jgi:hypothetical protein